MNIFNACNTELKKPIIYRYLINVYIQNEDFPGKFNPKTVVRPIFKKGEEREMENYWLISL